MTPNQVAHLNKQWLESTTVCAPTMTRCNAALFCICGYSDSAAMPCRHFWSSNEFRVQTCETARHYLSVVLRFSSSLPTPPCMTTLLSVTPPPVLVLTSEANCRVGLPLCCSAEPQRMFRQWLDIPHSYRCARQDTAATTGPPIHLNTKLILTVCQRSRTDICPVAYSKSLSTEDGKRIPCCFDFGRPHHASQVGITKGLPRGEGGGGGGEGQRGGGIDSARVLVHRSCQEVADLRPTHGATVDGSSALACTVSSWSRISGSQGIGVRVTVAVIVQAVKVVIQHVNNVMPGNFALLPILETFCI